MAGPGRTGGKKSAAKKRNASLVKSRNPKTRSQKALSSSKKAPRTKSSIIDLKKQIERQARELEEARQQQAAASRVLHIIGASGALTPVFQAIVKNAVELCGARFGAVFKMEGDLLHLAAHNFKATQRKLLEAQYPMTPNQGHASGRAILTRSVVQIPDVNIDEDYRGAKANQSGFRSLLATPLLRSGRAIGSIVIYKAEPGMFPARQLNLLQNFAAQAVIAIENTRLFNETKEALERQRATTEVLTAISGSMADAKPVFEVIVQSCERLFESSSVGLMTVRDGQLDVGAYGGQRSELIQAMYPAPLSRHSASGVAILDRRTLVLEDIDAPGVPPMARDGCRALGMGSAIFAPLLADGRSIGSLFVGRPSKGAFAPERIALVEAFASQAVIAIENSRLFNEVQAKTHDLEEALRYQTGSANILNVIASSPTNVQPVLQAIVESACELCGAYDALVRLRDGDGMAFGGHHGPLPVSLASVPFSANSTAGRAMIERKPVHVHDLLSPEGDTFPDAQELARAHGERTILSVPLLRENESIGAIILRRTEVHPFSESQIALLQTFADQAVIAIGNARLFNEAQEALERQTATADILKVIASSPTNFQPVFDTIAERANRLIGGHSTAVVRFNDGMVELAAFTPIDPQADAALRASFPVRQTEFQAFELTRTGDVLQLTDSEAEHVPERTRNLARARGFRSVLSAPLVDDRSAIGAINVARKEPGEFADHHKQLLRTFADQAVIAIKNVELFEEVQAKTHDLEEALRYQTGSANILNVIASSPTNVEPVLRAVVESACDLCEAYDAVLVLKHGNELHVGAHHGEVPLNRTKWPSDRSTISGRAIFDQSPVHVHDIVSERDQFPTAEEMSRRDGGRTVLGVPLIRDRESVGALVLRRTEVHPFNEKQISLLQTFADQAVIAIGNVRLFEEVQARTRDLQESLQQQTATADVLKVISRSAFDLQTVLDTLVESAARLCEADMSLITRQKGDQYFRAGSYGFSAEFMEHMKDLPVRPERGTIGGRTLLEGRVVHVPDVHTDPDYTFWDAQRLGGDPRTILGVPLLREGKPVGALVLLRRNVRPFTEKQIELVTTFADQAVIAIENVRLFDEVQDRTRDLQESLQQQTATADVLKVISRSAFNLDSVMNTLTQSAAELCKSDFSALYLRHGELLIARGLAHTDSAQADFLRRTPLQADGSTYVGRTLLAGSVRNIADYREETEIGLLGRFGEILGFRSILFVPLMRKEGGIGVFALARKQTGHFSQREVELVQTFADQAVIAIENARLFDEVQSRTKELAQSLDDLRAAQDRLVQTEKLASLGQLTAGIAHEIKNPLNFVNNFSALSAELVDEMTDVFENPAIDEASRRKELDEIRELLKSNLEKVVQHGKRADSIVKNMLLHSREGSGELRAADINGLVEESLNLAYHGARAEKSGFNITLQRDFDASTGAAELYPQEITRALLNLISNGFYAATKRKTESGEAGFEPALSAKTRNLGASVEIRIRDNGTGIPPEVKEKIFNPFFTTKPAGEGTGLGLSMTHDIVVKQHGGTIRVDIEPGVYTEFIVTLPRTTGAQNNQRSTR